MLLRNKITMMALLGALAALAAQGQTAPAAPATPGENTAFIAKFVDSQTVLVGHVDATRIDTAALVALVSNLLDAARVPADAPERSQLATGRTMADTFLARFKQLGGRHAFIVWNQLDVWPSFAPPAILLKVEPGGDAKLLAELVKALGVAVTPLGDQVLFVGDGPVLKRLQALKPEPRPELAFQGATAAAEAVGTLTADQRRVIGELMPTLPAEIGGGATDAITRNVQSVSLRLRLPPGPQATLVFSIPGPAQNAEGLKALITAARDRLLADPVMNEELNRSELKAMAGDIRTMATEVLSPAITTVEGGRTELSLQITETQFTRVFSLLIPDVNRARLVGKRTQSMANIRQVLMSCIVYAADHKGVMPESLDELVKSGALAAQVLVNPSDPKGRRYVYKRWIPKVPNDGQIPLVWEETDDPSQGLSVGFSDGHVEFFQRRSDVEALWKKAEEWAKTQPQ